MDAVIVEPVVFLSVTALVFFVIGIGKGGLGGTISTIATPVMALVLPAQTALAFVLPILIIADWFSVYFYWREWNFKIILLLLPGCLVGIAAGTLFIDNAPTQTIGLVLGIIVLLVAVYLGFIDPMIRRGLDRDRVYEEKFWHTGVSGTVAGFSSALAAMGSPPIIVYLLYRDDLQPRAFLATLVFLFAILNIIKVPTYLVIGLFDFSLYSSIIYLLPLVPLGVWIGQWMVKKIDKELFNKILIGILFFLGALLIVRNTGIF